MIDVLTDLLRVAQDRGLQETAAGIAATIQVGQQEIEQQSFDAGKPAEALDDPATGSPIAGDGTVRDPG